MEDRLHQNQILLKPSAAAAACFSSILPFIIQRNHSFILPAKEPVAYQPGF